MVMEDYYRERAPEYDRFYEIAEFAADISQLREWLLQHSRGRTILEVAAGTGYWTAAAASVAASITATDYNPEMIAIAANRNLGPSVALLTADAYALPAFAGPFDMGMAHLWWSHVPKQRQRQFLADFTAKLQPRSTLLLIDQIYLRNVLPSASRRDRWGNRYEIRRVQTGRAYEIIKNYPSALQLERALAAFCDDIEVIRLRNFWALRARTRRQ